MARIRIYGLENWTTNLEELGDDIDKLCGQSIGVGAGIIADAVREELEAIPIDEHYGTPSNPVNGLTRLQKQGLLDSFGISPMDKDGSYLNVKLGFDGYNNEHTALYPNGKPNTMIARSLESGTSFSKKIRFFTRAVSRSKEQAQRKMDDVMQEEIRRIMEG